MDREGKDSYRFTKAGADTMIIASENKMAMVKNIEEDHSIEDVINYFENMDLIIVEGFKSNHYPQIEIHRKERSSKLLYRDSSFDTSNFIAVITDELLKDLKLPQLHLNNIGEIVEFIEKNVIKK
nr:molybdopterin-guanine dinucleotide biosynthesis protein B [Clostridium pasteurianum]